MDSTVKQKLCIEIQDLAETEEIPSISSTEIKKVEIDKDGITTRLKKMRHQKQDGRMRKFKLERMSLLWQQIAGK